MGEMVKQQQQRKSKKPKTTKNENNKSLQQDHKELIGCEETINNQERQRQQEQQQQQQQQQRSNVINSNTNAIMRYLPPLEFVHGPTFELGVCLMRRAFTEKECLSLLNQIPQMSCCSRTIEDRHDELNFRHFVWRVEDSIQQNWPWIYERLLQYIYMVDNIYWRRLGPRPTTARQLQQQEQQQQQPTGKFKSKRRHRPSHLQQQQQPRRRHHKQHKQHKHLHPEIEYIVYQHVINEPLPVIEPHVDNASVITMVCMLSKRDDYAGGRSCFEGQRLLPILESGDVILFRGEECEHWITPVTSGRRVILQIEMCKHKEGRH